MERYEVRKDQLNFDFSWLLKDEIIIESIKFEKICFQLIWATFVCQLLLTETYFDMELHLNEC